MNPNLSTIYDILNHTISVYGIPIAVKMFQSIDFQAEIESYCKSHDRDYDRSVWTFKPRWIVMDDSKTKIILYQSTESSSLFENDTISDCQYELLWTHDEKYPLLLKRSDPMSFIKEYVIVFDQVRI